MLTIPKLTVKAIVGDFKPLLCVENLYKTIPVARIIGIIRKKEVIDGDRGQEVRFLGSFKGISLLDDSSFESKRVCLSKGATACLEKALYKHGDNIEFAYDVNIEFTDEGRYNFTYKSLIDITQDNPLERLSTSLPATLKKLTKSFIPPTGDT